MNVTAIKPIIKGTEVAPKSERSQMETLIFTREQVDEIKLPPFQRPLRINPKVREIAEELKKNGGILQGVITLGKVGRDQTLWLVDGQHRLAAYKLSELPEVCVDVRIVTFDTMAEMAQHFVDLNSQIVRMRPDDVLRGLEGTHKPLQYIRQNCDFVGYDQIRRGNTGASMLSVSILIRCWSAARNETPSHTGARSAALIVETVDMAEAQRIVAFLLTVRAAWGDDPENFRLWGALNLTLCMWMWRKLVVEQPPATRRYAHISPEHFKKCLMSVSANRDYVEWLVGRQLTDVNRSPCYRRLKQIFVGRLGEGNSEKKVQLPSPEWAAR